MALLVIPAAAKRRAGTGRDNLHPFVTPGQPAWAEPGDGFVVTLMPAA